jgi:hypothetical protein
VSGAWGCSGNGAPPLLARVTGIMFPSHADAALPPQLFEFAPTSILGSLARVGIFFSL